MGTNRRTGILMSLLLLVAEVTPTSLKLLSGLLIHIIGTLETLKKKSTLDVTNWTGGINQVSLLGFDDND